MHDGDVLKEFTDLPQELDFSTPETWPKNWTIGCGGHPFPDSQWMILHIHDDLHTDIYPLPKTLNTIIIYMRRQQKDAGIEEVRNAIIRALGI